ncbi:MAG: hypothetical protein ACI9HK_000243 [Pirellulaceae bacterium]|jgi:hypothetical protein
MKQPPPIPELWLSTTPKVSAAATAESTATSPKTKSESKKHGEFFFGKKFHDRIPEHVLLSSQVATIRSYQNAADKPSRVANKCKPPIQSPNIAIVNRSDESKPPRAKKWWAKQSKRMRFSRFGTWL